MTSERLSAAAEELIRAASLESNAVGAEKTVQAIQNLRNDIKKAVAAFKESTDSKINTTNQNIETLKRKYSEMEDKLTKLSDNAIESNKMQRLEWAIANIDTVYHQNHDLKYAHVSRHSCHRCNDLLRDVLLCFRKNRGYNLGDYTDSSSYSYYDTAEVKQEKQKKFRDEFAILIHELTGSKPRIEARKKDGKENIVIWYS